MPLLLGIHLGVVVKITCTIPLVAKGYHDVCIAVIIFFYLFVFSLVVFTLPETPTNEAVNENFYEEEDLSAGFEEEIDLFSGAKEMEAYQESLMVKKSIQFNLGRRAGPRWSLPHQYIGEFGKGKAD